jgi:hypothetical protein
VSEVRAVLVAAHRRVKAIAKSAPGLSLGVALAQARRRWSIGSATDAVVDVCGLRRVDHPDDL